MLCVDGLRAQEVLLTPLTLGERRPNVLTMVSKLQLALNQSVRALVHPGLGSNPTLVHQSRDPGALVSGITVVEGELHRPGRWIVVLS